MAIDWYEHKRAIIIAAAAIVTLIIVSALGLLTYFIAVEDAESETEEYFQETLLPQVQDALVEIELFLADLSSFQMSIGQTFAALSAWLTGFERRAAISDAFDVLLQANNQSLRSVLAFSWDPIETSETIDEAVEFKRSRGFESFAIRPPGNRSLYVPVYDIVPLAENEEALGLDIWTNEQRRMSLIKARDTSNSIVTEPLTLVQSGKRAVALYRAAYSVFDGAAPSVLRQPSTLEERRELVFGYIAFVIEAAGLFDRTLNQLLTSQPLAICIFEKERTGDTEIDSNPLAVNVTNLVGCWPESDLNSFEGTFRVEQLRAFDPNAPTTAALFLTPLDQLWVAFVDGRRLELEPSLPPGVIVAIVATATFALATLIGGIVYGVAMRRAIKSARKARENAEAMARAKSAFLAHISHELRTPLNGVLGMIEVALTDVQVPAVTAENLTLARDSAMVLLDVIKGNGGVLFVRSFNLMFSDNTAAAKLIIVCGNGTAAKGLRAFVRVVKFLSLLTFQKKDVLDFTKVEAGNMRVENIPFDVEDLVVSVVRMHILQAEVRQLQVFSRVDSSVPRIISSDPNLVGNAVKFSPTGSVRLYVSACEPLEEEEEEEEEEGEARYHRYSWSDSMDSLQETDPADDRTLLDDEPLESPVHLIQRDLRFRVIDTGIGISPEIRDEIFSPFVQAHSSTTRIFGGTGLGLAISSQLAALLGGRLSYASRGLSTGSCFELRIPLTACEEPAPFDELPALHAGGSEPEAMPLPPAPGFAPSMSAADITTAEAVDTVRSENVTDRPNAAVRTFPSESLTARPDAIDVSAFVVDDSSINLKVFTAMLRGLANVETASNGLHAVEACRRKMIERGWPPYEIVFMDLHMPVMNGIDAAREIRRLELEASASGTRLRRDRMPIVLVSAGSDVAIDPELFDEALYKPVSRDRLRATLSALLAESAQVTATART